MIAHLSGTLLAKHATSVVVDVGGVGYEVTIPVTTFYDLGDVKTQVSLRIYTHVREEALQLFGFRTERERELFTLLISVSGIGPTLAIKILSGLAAGDLTLAIRRGEVEKLVKVPGVGKKTAERMVLELRDKLPAPSGGEPGAPAAEALSPIDQDVLSALLNLGCLRPQAEAAVRKARSGVTSAEFEPLFRRALELVR